MAEHIVGIARSGGGAGDRLCAVDVGVRVLPGEGARAWVVLDHDALGADQLAAPLGVEVKLADGRRVGRVDLGCGVELAVFADSRLVEDDVVEAVGLRQGLVGVPADQVVVDPLAADVADLLAVARPELSCLGRAGVLDGVVRAVVRMEVDLVLSLAPLGVEGQVVGGHRIERVRIACAQLVVVPAEEHEALVRGVLVIFRARDVRLVVNVGLGVERGALDGIDRVAAAIHEDAVVVDYVVLVARVAEVEIARLSNRCRGSAGGPAAACAIAI